MSRTLPLECPKCKSKGLFPYEDKGLDPEYEGDGVTNYYKTVGIECPTCNHKIQTHRICVKTKFD